MPGTLASAAAVPAARASKRAVKDDAGNPASTTAPGTYFTNSVGTFAVNIAMKTVAMTEPIAVRTTARIARNQGQHAY